MTTPDRIDQIDQAFEVAPYAPPFGGLDQYGRHAGYLTLPGRQPAHQCTPPVLRDPSGAAAGDVGAVWRCPCGTLWTVYRLVQGNTGQRIADPFDRRWRRAGWLLRWRYRDAEPAEDPPGLLPGLLTRPGRLPRGGSGCSSASDRGQRQLADSKLPVVRPDDESGARP